MNIGRVLLDILFPPSSHLILLRDLPVDILCPLLQPKMHKDHLCLLPYHHPVVQAAITSLKFEQAAASAAFLAVAVTQWLARLPPQKTYVVPIPLSPRRERERGYNQVTEVLARVEVDTTVLPLLRRTRHTVAQTSLHKHDRIKNMQTAFAVNQRILARIEPGSRIIICDDVCTTGATLDAARAAMTSYMPPQVTIITVAWAH